MLKIFLVRDFECRFRFENRSFTSITGLDFAPSTDLESDTLFCNNLRDQFKEKRGCAIEAYKVSLELSKSDGSSYMTMRLGDSEGFLQTLKKKLLPDIQVGVAVTFNGVINDQNRKVFFPAVSINSKELLVADNALYPFGDDEVIGINYINRDLLRRNDEFFGKVTIYINTSKHKLPQQVDQHPSVKINKMILEHEIATDAAILPQNGAPVKCHKNFLMAHSSVFEAMFLSDMEEKATGTVEMPDISEEGVRAFLEYLYYAEDTKPKANSLIAFEMLSAGHKYDVPILESIMTKLMVSKPMHWYDVDVAVKLFLFARNMPTGNQLKMKSLNVLKRNYLILKQSTTYKELFNTNPDGAMELCQYMLEVWNKTEKQFKNWL